MFRIILQKETTIAVIIVVALISVAGITQKYCAEYMKVFAVKTLAPLQSADSIQDVIIDNTLTDGTQKITTLKNQYLICSKIKSYYKALGTTYYVNFYSFSICSIFFITLLSIAVFLVANQGWQSSSLILKTFLLATIVLSSVYYFLPNVLNNKNNLKSNMDKVLVFQKIQSDILSFSNKIRQVDTSQIDSCLTSNYDRISLNLDFLTSIDDTELRGEVTDLLKSYKPK